MTRVFLLFIFKKNSYIPCVTYSLTRGCVFFSYQYCNVDDKAFLGNDSQVKQQWKRSDRFYAMTQCTHDNNGGEEVFCVVGAPITVTT
jgi:hypothetical protein